MSPLLWQPESLRLQTRLELCRCWSCLLQALTSHTALPTALSVLLAIPRTRLEFGRGWGLLCVNLGVSVTELICLAGTVSAWGSHGMQEGQNSGTKL